MRTSGHMKEISHPLISAELRVTAASLVEYFS
jgi:hypothetical protein